MTQAQALAMLKTGANVFLTGEPGSGKTHTINEYVSYLRQHKIEPAITASTGIAATHIGGTTIHSWSGIGIRKALDQYDVDQLASNEYIGKRIRRTSVLIIDEVSMLAAETLTMVDMVCRAIKNNDYPFGGIQVVLVGDFFQLPPIVHAEDRANTTFAYTCSAWIQANPLVCYLTEQYRQDDTDFLRLLKAIRRNEINEDTLDCIVQRQVEYQNVPDSIPKLFSHNIDVDKVNKEMLDNVPEKSRVFAMSSNGPDYVVATLKKGCLSPEKLEIKVGAAVMFTKNNSKEGFVNGTLGTVTGFSLANRCPQVTVKSGRVITVEPMEWSVEENGRVRARITQLPLRLAWAITVHKSQGMSLDAAVMDLSQVFEFGQGYVALSRVRSLAGVHLLGWNERAFQVHPEVVIQDEIFQSSSTTAEDAFSEMTPGELQTLQQNFIIACGGKEKRTMGSTRKKVRRKKQLAHSR